MDDHTKIWYMTKKRPFIGLLSKVYGGVKLTTDLHTPHVFMVWYSVKHWENFKRALT
jgi:hypothetical protein